VEKESNSAGVVSHNTIQVTVMGNGGGGKEIGDDPDTHVFGDAGAGVQPDDSSATSSIHDAGALTGVGKSGDSSLEQKRMALGEISVLFADLLRFRRDVNKILSCPPQQSPREDARTEHHHQKLASQEKIEQRQKMENASVTRPELDKWMSITKTARSRFTEFEEEINRQVHLKALSIFARLEEYPDRSAFLQHLSDQFAIQCNECVSAHTPYMEAEHNTRKILARLWLGVVSDIRKKLGDRIPNFPGNH